MGDLVKAKQPCDLGCSSSDAMYIYTDVRHCYSCETTGPAPAWAKAMGSDTEYSGPDNTHQPTGFNNLEKKVDPRVQEIYEAAEFRGCRDRQIKKVTMERFGVKTDAQGRHIFPAYDKDGDLVAVKIIDPSKPKNAGRFTWVGSRKGRDMYLFGAHTQPKKSRTVTITEGEYDAMSSYQMSGSKYVTVSLWDGNDPKAKVAKDNYKYFDEFDTVITNFDNDEKGVETREAWGKVLGSKGRMEYFECSQYKDASDYLQNNAQEAYIREFWSKRKYMPGGIINGKDTWEKYQASKNVESIPWPSTWAHLNRMTYGIRFAEISLWCAGTSVGKTQILREIVYHWLTTTNHKIMSISLEEGIKDNIGGLMALEANRRIHLPDVDISEDEEKAIHDKLFGSGRYYAMDHEGSVEGDTLLNKIEYAAKVEGVKIFLLDHITIALSEVEAGSENSAMDKMTNALLKLVKRLNIHIMIVSHLRKVGGGNGKTFEQGRVPTEDDLKGSGSLKQVSFDIYALARNKYAADDVLRNTTGVYSLKCRFTGRTGEGDFLYYNDENGRMNVVDKPSNWGKDDEEQDNETSGYVAPKFEDVDPASLPGY